MPDIFDERAQAQPDIFDERAGAQGDVFTQRAKPHYASPYVERKPQEWQKNVGLDLGDLMRAGTALWSVGNLRAREGFLDIARNQATDPTVKQELYNAGARSFLDHQTDWWRPKPGSKGGDWQYAADALANSDLGRLATGLVDYYRGEYINPPFKDPAGFPGYLGEHWQKAPIATSLDLQPFVPLKTAGKLAKAASATAPGQMVAKAAKGVVRPAVSALPPFIQSSQLLPKWLRELTPAGEVDAQARKLISEGQNQFALDISHGEEAIDKATAGLSELERKLATPFAEESDEALRAQY